MNKILYYLCFITIISLASVNFSRSFADNSHKEQQREIDYYDYYLLLKFTSRGYVLTQTLPTYKLDEGLYLSLDALSSAVYFPIDVSAVDKEAKGSFLEKEFYLDLKNNSFFIDSANKNEDIHYFKVIDNDIFIAEALASDLFKMVFSPNLKTLTLNMDTDLELPVYTEIDFKKRKKAFETQNNTITLKDKTTTTLDNPYTILGDPALSLRTSHKYDNDNITSVYNAIGKSDLFYYESDYGIAGDLENIFLSDARIRFTDNQSSSDYMKFLAFGDVSAPTMPLIGGAGDGRGVFISNKKQDYTQTADNYRLEGFAKANTEIELYRNNFLLAITDTDASGRYIFEGLQLDPGVNLFHIIKYGEFGKRVEENRRVTLAGNVKKGELKYQAFLGQPNQKIFDFLIDDTKDKQQNYALSTNFDYGLTDLSSVGFGLMQHNIAGEDKMAIQTGIRFSALGSGYYDMGIATFNTGERKSNLYIGYNFDEINVSLQREDNINFDKNTPSDRSSISINNTYSLDNNIHLGGVFSFENLNYTQDQYTQNTFQIKGNIGFPNFTLENELRWLEDSRKKDITYLGQSRVNMRYKNHTIRNFLDYHIDTTDRNTRLDSLRTVYRYRTQSFNDITLDYMHQFKTDQWDLSGSLSFPFKYFIMGVGGTYNKNNELTANLNFNFAFRAHRNKTSLDIIPHEFSGRAAAQFKGFYDENKNATQDEDEETISGIIFKSRGNISAQADKNDIAYIQGFSNNTKTTVEVDTTSLGNIYLKPAHDAYDFTPRLGSNNVMAIPIITSGGIEGMVYNHSDNMILKLQKADNKDIIQETYIDSDGYYIFENIIQGDYYISLMNNDSKQCDSQVIHVTREQAFHSDINFHADQGNSDKTISDIILEDQGIDLVI